MQNRGTTRGAAYPRVESEGAMRSQRVGAYVETVVAGVVDGARITAMFDDWVRLGATPVWLIDGAAVTRYTRDAVAEATTRFADTRLATIVAVLTSPFIVMGAKTVAMSLALVGAADVRVVASRDEGTALAASLARRTPAA